MSNSKGVALITGASSGIGAAYADRLAGRGFDLILVARRQDRLDSLAERLRKTHGRNIEVFPADLGNAGDLARVEGLIRTRQDIEILVNNAGLGALGPSASVDAKAVDTLVKVNVLALTHLSLAAVPAFAQRNRGTIINLGSIIAIIPSPGGASYSASKAYVLNFSRSMQLEFAKTNVKVQVVMPGPVRSEFFGEQKPPFPDQLFMSAETLVDSALSALDQGELVCFPTLHDEAAWEAFDGARGALAKAITQDGKPAARYKITSAA
jgi:short-subunit dehydrogenase